MNRIAIIPARSGSKGLKDKNILEICGVPLLAHSIVAAIKTGLFSRVILSTDSVKYAEIGKAYGAEVFMRGEELSNDNATSFMVIEDVLFRLGETCDYFVLLQPTSPLRGAKHIEAAIRQFEKRYDEFDFLVSMKEAEHASALVRTIESDLSLKNFDIDYSNYRRQQYKEYSPNGAIFIAKPKEYLAKGHFFGARSMAFLMNKKESIDIDDELDYKIARFLMEEKDND